LKGGGLESILLCGFNAKKLQIYCDVVHFFVTGVRGGSYDMDIRWNSVGVDGEGHKTASTGMQRLRPMLLPLMLLLRLEAAR